MSTQSITRVIDDSGAPLICMYRHSDGYPTGHGKELAEFLTSGELVNGLGLTNDTRVFNGMGCLAAQLVTEFKREPGGIYLKPIEGYDDDDDDYTYRIEGGGDAEIKVTVAKYGWKIFEGTVGEFKTFCEKEES